MIPLRDLHTTYRRSRPVTTYLLIALNAAVFLYQLELQRMPGAAEAFVQRWSFIPYYFTKDPRFHSLDTPLTSMFLHGGLKHLLLNMWFLHIFGDNVEDALGSVRFAAYYIACGLCAAFAQLLVDPASRIPMVGASGAIAGVLGGYFRLFPRARVLALTPFFFTVELPAVVFLILWFGLQLWSGFGLLLATHHRSGGGVAFFAHIGGFIAGALLVRLLQPRRIRVQPAGFKRMIPQRRWESYRDE